jgi:hypothetical protein
VNLLVFRFVVSTGTRFLFEFWGRCSGVPFNDVDVKHRQWLIKQVKVLFLSWLYLKRIISLHL